MTRRYQVESGACQFSFLVVRGECREHVAARISPGTDLEASLG